MTCAILYDDIFLDHRDMMWSHPECPERLIAAKAAMERAGLGERTQARSPRPATREELARVHTDRYLDVLEENVPGQNGRLDGDTYFSTGSWTAALGAAGGAVDLAVDVLQGREELTFGMGLIRPPGHHAEASRGMGFCLLNNVAIAAEAALGAGAARVAILDWDVHHGNGTQNSFYERNDVLYLSIHRYPFYPGSGAATEVGKGDGKGFTVNVPVPGGVDDAGYGAAFEQVLVPVMTQFDPDLILLSAGFDAHQADPLGGMDLSDMAYRMMSRKIRGVAEKVCAGRVAAVLEGGYNVEAQARAIVALCEEMLADEVGDEQEGTGPPSSQVSRIIDQVKKALGDHWDL